MRPIRIPPAIPTRLAVLGAALLASLVSAPSAAQVQDKEQQKCINSLNKAGARVAATQGKASVACVKAAGKGTEADATTCLSADPKDKLAKAATKVSDAEVKSCSTAPDFGATPAVDVVDAAVSETLALATDILGDDLTSSLVASSADADAARCQAAVFQNSQKLADLVVKEFLACKKSGLKDASLDSVAALGGCFPQVAADEKGKLAKARIKMRDTVLKSCAGMDADELFPGACEGHRPLFECVVTRARCRACSMIASMDGLGAVCDPFDDGLPANSSCGTPVIVTEVVTLASAAQPAETPGSPGVIVTNPKLLAQFPPDGPDLNHATYLRWRLSGPDLAPEAILILIPGFGGGANNFRALAEDFIPKMMAQHGVRVEIWGFMRRTEALEDRAGALIALAAKDPAIALDWYFGGELGLDLHPDLVAGPNRRAEFYNATSDIPFLANFTAQVFSEDIDVVVEAARSVTPNVFLGGHSAGTGFTARYAATDFDLSGMGPPDPGYAKLRGLVLFEGGGGSVSATPLTDDTLDRIIAKADGGLFGAVRDGAARCVDGTTPCTIANEAADCIAQDPPKCTPATSAYTALGGLTAQITATAEVAGIQGLKDPESGQVILQVDQGSPGNNAVEQVPGLALLSILPNSTVEGVFGTFLDDDGLGASISPALATSLGAPGPLVGGLLTWISINDDRTIPGSARPNNGPAPTTLPAGIWGREVEVVRMDRHRSSFIAEGGNAADWYYAGSGLSVTSVAGVCTAESCTAGRVGEPCTVNADCSQSIGLDSTQLAVDSGRPDIANFTQAGSIDIPVISFGGSNGLTPVGASFLGFAQSIGACAAPSCDGTARVVDANLPNEAFPTYGDIAGGYEVYISEGYAHVDVVAAEDTEENLIPERLAAFLLRNIP